MSSLGWCSRCEQQRNPSSLTAAGCWLLAAQSTHHTNYSNHSTPSQAPSSAAASPSLVISSPDTSSSFARTHSPAWGPSVSFRLPCSTIADLMPSLQRSRTDARPPARPPALFWLGYWMVGCLQSGEWLVAQAEKNQGWRGASLRPSPSNQPKP